MNPATTAFDWRTRTHGVRNHVFLGAGVVLPAVETLAGTVNFRARANQYDRWKRILPICCVRLAMIEQGRWRSHQTDPSKYVSRLYAALFSAAAGGGSGNKPLDG